MKILNTYPESLTNKQLYQLTMSPKAGKMKDARGGVVEIAAFCEYVDVDKDDNERTVLSILTPQGEILATNSPTFLDDFHRMVDLFGPAGVTAIEVITGTSKNGREFVTCAYAGE